MLSFSWVKVCVSGFYAVQDTKTPVIIAAASMVLNILLNCVLVGPLGYKGLALATTISYTVNFVFLYMFLSEKFGKLWDGAFLTGLFRMVVAALMMAVVTYGAHAYCLRIFPGDGVSQRAAIALLPIVAAVCSYAGFSAALAIPEFRSLLSVARSKVDDE